MRADEAHACRDILQTAIGADPQRVRIFPTRKQRNPVTGEPDFLVSYDDHLFENAKNVGHYVANVRTARLHAPRLKFIPLDQINGVPDGIFIGHLEHCVPPKSLSHISDDWLYEGDKVDKPTDVLCFDGNTINLDRITRGLV